MMHKMQLIIEILMEFVYDRIQQDPRKMKKKFTISSKHLEASLQGRNYYNVSQLLNNHLLYLTRAIQFLAGIIVGRLRLCV